MAIATAAAAFNYTVDPYLLFDVQRVPGFNELKPSVDTRERMMKAYQAERVVARTLVLGSSRPDLGIDPASSAWPASAKPVYNLGLAGGNVSTALHYLRHYLASQPGKVPQTVLVGLDFEAFLYRADPATAAPATPDELEQRLAVDGGGKPNEKRYLRVLSDHALGLLSLDAVFDSVRTIAGNRGYRGGDLKPDGHLSDAALRSTAESDGFKVLFDHKNIETVKQFSNPRRMLSDTPGGPIRHLHSVAELLAYAKEHRIDVVLMIQPAHVSRLELLDRMGYWRDYERWKRELTTMVAQAGARQRVALWDFGGYEGPAREVVPAKAGHAGMQWFLDPVHYSTALGNLMLARIFDAESSGQYGVLLTSSNIEEHLMRVRHDRSAFRTDMPDEAARLARLACGDAPCPPAEESLTVSR